MQIIHSNSARCYSLLFDDCAGKYYLSIPLTKSFIDYEEYYEIDSSLVINYPSSALEIEKFADRCRKGERFDLCLVGRPEFGYRGAPDLPSNKYFSGEGWHLELDDGRLLFCWYNFTAEYRIQITKNDFEYAIQYSPSLSSMINRLQSQELTPSEKVSISVNYQATLDYSALIIRKAIFVFWRHMVGFTFIFLLILLGISSAMMNYYGYSSWLVATTAAMTTIGFLLSCAIFKVHYTNSLKKFRHLRDSSLLLRVNEKYFTFISASGVVNLQWDIVKELVKGPDVWIFLFSKSEFSTLPLARISNDMKEFIQNRVQAAGGKVTNLK